MEGRAAAPAAGTVLNALANGYGSAFAIDAYTEATVTLDDTGSVTGEIADAPDADTRLIERCVEAVVERFGDGQGGHVRTESDVPMASGLKSSSAAANATVLATLAALDVDLDREAACRIGVDAARDVGVTVTGAFDDASASMLGGVTVTDNTSDELLQRDEPDWDVLVYTPDERAFSADADADRCERIAPMADVVYELARDGDYERAMCVNGFAFCAALGYPTDPLVEALPAAAASLSGTGPSYTAVGDRETLESLETTWSNREGHTWLTTTQQTGATRK
ncbi:shikimate kinase, archaeal-type [Natronomonas pharaonis DSM 2160]|uniref:Shikimate kinase n=1 Tax=Natronomonas pharaonis (strain ATCC 35678 / DSM 2160 / CIP 103997 / JCM 8858 / NBRC 14720 / NCIMB 2260 / Gabara) TaxID=348780 RepID=A0A1U7EY02_NATPD|nr:shikimate kinase [Natronomonas pharaonis]CAI50082.2 shikimate kinase, archaeal-type [Natronomonas pharaonis DSM 2160]